MSISRRRWLAAVAVGAAGLGAAARFKPGGRPPDLGFGGAPVGEVEWRATTCRECPAGCGVLAKCVDGRAVKCEGLPGHPVNDGKLCARGQAAVQRLHGPERVERPSLLGREVAWDEAVRWAADALGNAHGRVWLLTGLETGALDGLARAWLAAFASKDCIRYEPIAYESQKQASLTAYGVGVVPTYDLGLSTYVLSLGADFLDTWLSPVQFARQFSATRTFDGPTRASRLVYVGPRMSCTAATADRRYLRHPSVVGLLGLAIANAIVNGERPTGREGEERWAPIDGSLRPIVAACTPEAVAELAGVEADEIRAIAREFASARGAVALGGEGDAAMAALLLNAAVATPAADYAHPHAVSEAATLAEMARLCDAMRSGEVGALVVSGVDPVRTLPPALGFDEALASVPTVICMAEVPSATSERAALVFPRCHPLEEWGDFSPTEGIHCLTQPASAPRGEPRALGEILLAIAGAVGADVGERSWGDRVRAEFGVPPAVGAGPPGADALWGSVVRQGGRFVEHPAEPPRAVPQLRPDVAAVALDETPSTERVLHAPPSPLLHDGRAGDSSWLHEVPDPLTRVAWGSWVELSPSDAREHGIGAFDRVRVSTAAGSVIAPAFIWEGVAPGVVAVHLGRDREPARGPGRGQGCNAFSLLVPGEPFPPVEIARLGGATGMAIGQPSSDQRGMQVARTCPAEREGASAAVDLACLAGDPECPGPDGAHPRWALSVDLSKCTGCAACVVACYAENNIRVVGPDDVARSRDMAWLRVDRYLDWSSREAPVLFMPVMCQHCDAPSCAAACPVSAPRRTADGLTLQAYGRCTGARRCAGHCPYRVLRFNWSDPGADGRASTSLNPEVPPRGRGIVEKCTFCAHRIREGQRRAEAEGRALADGEVQPACVQTCPTGALGFGDARRPDSHVGRTARHNARAYQALDARGTRPGVVYLSRVVGG